MSLRWFKGKQLTDRGPTLHEALERATKHQPARWYRVVEIKVEKTNPISDYRVIVTPTTTPPP